MKVIESVGGCIRAKSGLVLYAEQSGERCLQEWCYAAPTPRSSAPNEFSAPGCRSQPVLSDLFPDRHYVSVLWLHRPTEKRPGPSETPVMAAVPNHQITTEISVTTSPCAGVWFKVSMLVKEPAHTLLALLTLIELPYGGTKGYDFASSWT